MGFDGVTIEYLCYLMNRVGLEAEGQNGYLRLCETLQEIEYVPQADMDENRCGDCMDLRRDFAEYQYSDESKAQIMAQDILDEVYGECGTMLELMIVIAEKMAYEMYDSQYEASTRKWFLEILVNCGLEKNLTNSSFDDEGNEETVKNAIDSVIFRRTGWDGEGGFFPLSYPQYDQRKVEIFVQMNNYLEENYDI